MPGWWDARFAGGTVPLRENGGMVAIAEAGHTGKHVMGFGKLPGSFCIEACGPSRGRPGSERTCRRLQFTKMPLVVGAQHDSSVQIAGRLVLD